MNNLTFHKLVNGVEVIHVFALVLHTIGSLCTSGLLVVFFKQ